MCIECHRGPLFTDYRFHVTGVEQRGENAPSIDPGPWPFGTGTFYTAPLRQISETGPYMHDGSLQTLADVIWFYRQGGAATGYVGEKDPLMQPLDITDDEARDLEAFLCALKGDDIAPQLTRDLRP
jgi:cytochrome c peroxidase